MSAPLSTGLTKGLVTGAVLAGLLLTAAALAPSDAPGAASTVKTSAVPSAFTVKGNGWGHGVGMSQYGAQVQASQGRSAAQILEHYYHPAKVSKLTGYRDREIVVQLLRSPEATMLPESGRARLKVGGKIVKLRKGKVVTTFAGKTYTGNAQIQWQNTRAWKGSAATLLNVAKADDGRGTVPLRHGVVDLKPLDGKVNVTATMRMRDEYLNGLAEVPSSWPSQALQAQAIAARTYSIRNLGSLKSACGCNVYDEVDSQKFTGWRKEHEGTNGVYGKRWVGAVAASNDKVVMYKSHLIDATYFSSSGGKTRSAKDVWGGDPGYLNSRDDHWSLRSAGNAWTQSVSQRQMAQAFGTKDVVSVAVTRRADLTLAKAVATTRSGKKVSLGGATFRARLAPRSAWVRQITAS
jgi:SpoIID/LytB domain protein